MDYRLSTPHSTLTYHDGTLIFTNTDTGKTVTLGGGNEFVLYLCDKTGRTFLRRDKDAVRVSFKLDGSKELSILYALEGVVVYVGYIAEGNVFRKNVMVTSMFGNDVHLRRITVENRRASAPVTRGGEGQPVFVGDDTTARLFCGTEFPVANNLYEGNTLCFTQAPYAELNDTFVSRSVVYGVDTCGDLSATFLSHIRSKMKGDGKPLRVYCDWGLHDDLTPDDPILTAAMTLENIPRVAELNQKSDAGFDYYLMDAFWFERGKPYTRFRSDTFPEGMTAIKDALDKAGLKLGLWFDINGIHTGLASLPELAQYNTELGNGALCLACDEVADLICDGMLKQIRELDVRLIKLDFGYFECKNPNHHHSTDFTESKERAVKNFIRMMHRLHLECPELKILCYNGWMTDLSWMNTPNADRRGYAVSPYWCEYADYIYCGDPRPSSYPSENTADSLVWYTDGMMQLFANALMPFEAIDDDGAMMGHTATIYRLGKAHFRQSILMDVMRGGRKLMLYGDLRDLEESDYAYLSFINTLFTRATEGDYTTRLFGDPVRGEVYGYDTGRATEGFCVVVNPTAHDVIHYITSPRFGSGVTAAPVIVNGETVEPTWQDVGNVIPVRVFSHGYALVEWKLTPMEKGFDKIVMLPGDSITFRTEGMTVMELSFTKDGAPLKTVTGLPPQFSVTSGDKELTPSLQNPVWAGISWAHYPLHGETRVTLTNRSDLSFTLKYQFK